MRAEVELSAGALRARLYDLVHRGTPGDVEHYVALCRGAARVLELGCGSGRVLRALAAAGAHTTGVDSDPAMLDAARAATPPELASRVALVEADMRAVRLRERFDRVILPYNALWALQSHADVVRALSVARAHLAPGGLVGFDAYAAEAADAAAEAEDDAYEPLVQVHDRGQQIDVSVREGPGLGPCSVRVHYRHVIRTPGRAARVVDTSIHHHYVPPAELTRLLARAGLEVVALRGGFDGRPFGPDSELMVVIAAPAAGASS